MVAHVPLRIVIVEDHVMFREIIRKLCVEEFGHQVVGEAGDGRSGIRKILEASPDLVLLDLNLPDIDGFGVIDVLHKALSKSRIIAISVAHGSYLLYQLERASIDGFVDKASNSLATLREAIQTVGSGRRYFSAVFAKARAARLADPASFEKVLSDRERHVLGLIGLSLDDREIASRLRITPKTAESFRARIMAKLNVHSTPKLIRFAIANGFTPLNDTAMSAPFLR
jgi:DNA-binding NarL/FixJ family response regulator